MGIITRRPEIGLVDVDRGAKTDRIETLNCDIRSSALIA
jgi:hypothetical protein